MALNPSKTKCMLITTRQKRQNMKHKFTTPYISNCQIEEVDSHKLLGVTIDKNLTWRDHISKLCKQISTKLYALSRIKHMINTGCKRIFFFAHIQSLIDYASTIWDGSSEDSMKKLKSLHRRSLKLITSKNKIEKHDYVNQKILPLNERFKFNKGVMVFKSLKGLSPPKLSKMFTKKHPRDPSKIYLPSHRIDLFKSTFQYSGSNLWNKLPYSVRSSGSLFIFRKKYYAELLKTP